MKKLVLFIHGLGGDADATWGKFPELMRTDTKLMELYDVKTLEYSTGAFGSKPSLVNCAAILKTEIDNRYLAYSDIALIAHSQGGLVARYYIADRLNGGQPLRVNRLLTFATPHQGSGLASLLKQVPFASKQVDDLDPNSEFLQTLAVAWGQAKPELRGVLTKYVVANADAVVGPVSAMGQWSPGYEVVGNVGHRASVKPGTADDTSFLIAKKFLLEEDLKPGGVEPDYRAPMLRFNYVEPGESTRFIYSARVLPFVGRNVEINILSDFLGGPEQPFRWMLMHGSGGIGKSRLALELCYAVRNEWHAGFLRQDGQEPDWGRWQPFMPTLIVIDYAARDTERTGRILRALAGRGPADGTARLTAPVRVLLLERTGADDIEHMGGSDWLKKIMGFGPAEAQVQAARAPSLPLVTIDDPWQIFEYVLNEKGIPLPDKAETLTALAEIDPERRPLFAYFAADAIAHGDDIREFNREQLVGQVIDRSREAYWLPAGAKAEDERLLAVVTMAGGVHVEALNQVTEKLLPTWDIDRHPAIFMAMTGRESVEDIAPLEPNIVGEHFVLACLVPRKISGANRARLFELAWQLNPLGVAEFVLRVMHDFRLHNPDVTRALLNDLRTLAVKRDTPGLWESWVMAAAVSIGGDLDSLIQNSVLAVSPSRIPTNSSANIFFLENPLVTRDPDAARALLDDMRSVAEVYDKYVFWNTWSYAAIAFMDDLIARDPVAAWTLLDNVGGVTAAKDDEGSFIWTAWMKNIVNAAASGWLERTHDVATARNDASLWETWANRARDHFGFLITIDPVKARTLLDNMRGVAVKRGEAALWVRWAEASASLIVALGSSDPATSRALVGDMLRVLEENPGNVGGWQTAVVGLVLQAAFGLTEDLATRDPEKARVFCAEVLGLPEEMLQMIRFGG